MKKIYANNDKTKYAIVDDDAYETIQQIGLKFSIDKRENKGYFYSTTKIKLPGMMKKKRLYLHHFVWILKTETEPSSTVDHIDRYPRNNQYSNLRLATMQEQNRHRRKMKNNSSGMIGVCHVHDKRRENNNYYWLARIRRPDGKNETKCFPYTKNGKQHAAMWYDDRVREYFRDFAGELNFPTPSNRQ